ncbi:MAG: outer membrane beta-barrel protein [Sinimarinibacterium sp.]|jgi:hypothetical protein
MKKLGVLAVGLVMSAAVFAQDEALTEPTADSSYAEPAPEQGDAAAPESGDAAAAEDSGSVAEEAAPADAEAADAGATEDGSADAGSTDAGATDAAADEGTSDATASDSYATDSGASDSASSESSEEVASDESGTEAEGEQEEPSWFYVGGDYVWTSVSFSKDSLAADFGAEELDSKMYRVHAGMRVFEAVSVEAQVGFDGGSSDDPLDGEYNTKQFFGVYLVPTGVLFDLIEVGGAIGYASTRLERGDVSETLSGASFGVNLDIPLFTSDSLELRVGGGATVFRAQNSARIHGYHAGVRIDFNL